MSQPLPLTLVGYTAASLTTLSFFPQAFKVLRSGDTRALSLSMCLLRVAALSTWLLYGLCIRDGPLITANAITLLPTLVVLERKLRSRPSEGLRLWRGP